MSHPLEKQIALIRRKVKLLVWFHSLSLVLGATLATAMLLGSLDYLSHFNLALRRVFADPGIRIICSLVVAGVLCFTVYRFLFRGVRASFANLDLALRVESRFPELQDRLSSAVEFLQEAEDDPYAGSAALRRAVIAQATAESEEIELAEVVYVFPALRAGVVTLSLMLIATLALVFDPSSTGIALARLANPLGGLDWPQENHLRFEETITRTATGQPLELSILETRPDHSLPKEITLFVRYDGSSELHEFPMKPRDVAAVYRFASVSRPFSYWAEGGDDESMRQQPIHLEVIEPPEVATLEVRLHPPAYTRWPSVDSDRQIHALEGTRVAFKGRSTKPLKAATLCVSDGGKVERKFSAQVDADGYGFALAAEGDDVFTVANSGRYWFVLVDAEGIEGKDASYEIRGIADTPPSVLIEEPRREAEFTAEAVVTIHVAVKDDLAIRDIVLRFSRLDIPRQGQESVTESILLYHGPEQSPDQPEGLAISQLGETRSQVYRWQLKELKLSPGMQLEIFATASDYRLQTGKSQPSLRLRIITPDQLLERISERQRRILAKLEEVLTLQLTARGQLQGVQIQFEEVGQLKKADLDGLQRTKMVQDQVGLALTSETVGVAGQIRRLLAHLRDNQVDSPAIHRRMNGLLEEIKLLEENQLPAVVLELKDAGAAAQSKLDALDDGPGRKQLDLIIGRNLNAADEHQGEVIAVLQRLLDNLSEWDDFHRFSRDVAAVLRNHAELARDTAKTGQDTLTKDIEDLTPGQRAALKKLAKRQQDLARRFDRIQQRMQRMKDQLQDENPLVAGVLEDALHHSRSRGISSEMRRTAGNLKRNQVGQASGRQRKTGENLREMLSILANRREQSLSRLVKKLKEAEQKLQDLIVRQKGLRKKMQTAAAEPDADQRRRELKRLAEKQRALQKEAERFARKLQRLRAEQAGRKASSAAGKMEQAVGQSEKGNSSAAKKAAEGALKDLQDAQQALEKSRQRAERDLAIEQLAKIEDTLEAMKNRQLAIVAETRRLETARTNSKQGRLTRGQRDSTLLLSRQEIQLMQDTLELAKKLAPAAVFSAALSGAGRELELAADLLARYETGASTQNAEQNALRRFEQLLSCLKPERTEGYGKTGGGGDAPPPEDGIPQLAQLKMLKLMQQEINQRTKALDARFGAKHRDELSETEQREFSIVSEQQGEIARLLQNLSRPSEPDPEDAADALPGFSLDDLDGVKDIPVDNNKRNANRGKEKSNPSP